MNCGETCISVERIYVDRTVADRFTELCAEKTRKLRLGAPDSAEAEVGPIIQEAQLEKVEAQLRDAVARGARVVTGGVRRPDLGANFLEPAVVTNVDHSMSLMREETFGPVIAIRAVSTVDEAVTLANDSPYSLAASVWTRDAKHGAAIASRLNAGSVMVNDVATYYGISEAPHGGSRARAAGGIRMASSACAKWCSRSTSTSTACPALRQAVVVRLHRVARGIRQWLCPRAVRAQLAKKRSKP